MGKPKNEYTFLLFDTSDSMNQATIHVEEASDDDDKKKRWDRKRDKKVGKGDLSRFSAAIQAAKNIVLTKKRIVDTDKFGIITYNSHESQLICDLSNDHDALIKTLDALPANSPATAAKKGKLAGAMSLAIQEFAKQLKFVGNLMLRIFIFTDTVVREGITAEERRLTEIARDIGAYVDILYLGSNPDNIGVDEDADADGFFVEEPEAEMENLEFGMEPLAGSTDRNALEESGFLIPGLEPESLSPGKTQRPVHAKKRRHKDLRLVAELTDGSFYDGDSSTATIAKWARKLGDIKDLEEGLDVFENAPVRKKRLMSAIAEELQPLGIAEIQEIMEGKGDLKCNICFQKTNAVYFRRCSYCKREMHLQCAMKWAEQDQDKDESFIFRCPFCFHLLKVDPSITKLMDLQTMRENVAKYEKSKAGPSKPRETAAFVLSPDQILQLTEPCEVCGILLEDDDTVHQCANCKAPYHARCFAETMQKYQQHCRRCEFKILS